MAEWKPIVLSLPSLAPTVAVEIIPHGLTVHRILVQKDARTNDIVISPEDPQHHLERKYTNTAIGRYTNRIPVGTHTIERHGVKNDFTVFSNESPKVSLHGGPVGFDSKVWTKLTEDDPPTLFTKSEIAHLPNPSSSHAFFRLVSEDGDQGYPGKLIVETLIAVIGPPEPASTPSAESPIGSVLFVYRAKLDTGDRKLVTPVNLTQHWGFNLDASLDDHELSVKEHTLTLNADRIVDRDADSLSTGKFNNVENDPVHNHTAKVIGEKYPGPIGYDDCYIFREPQTPLAPTRIPLSEVTPEMDLIKDLVAPASQAKPVATLTGKKSGLKLGFDSNQGAVMFYSNGFGDPTKGSRKKIHGGSGALGKSDSYTPGSAVFLEFHQPLTAFMMPEFKDKEDSLLTSDELYHNYTRMDIKSTD